MTYGRISDERSRMPYTVLHFINPMTLSIKARVGNSRRLPLTALSAPNDESAFIHGILCDMATITICSQVDFEVDQFMIGRCMLPICTALFRLYFNLTFPPIFFSLRIFQPLRFYHIFSFIRVLPFLDRFASTLVTAFEQSI